MLFFYKKNSTLSFQKIFYIRTLTSIVLSAKLSPQLSSSFLASGLPFTALINFLMVATLCSGVTRVWDARSYIKYGQNILNGETYFMYILSVVKSI